MRNSFLLSILVASMVMIGWKSPAVETDFSAVMESPDRFRNQSVAFTADVVENALPNHGEYKEWTFVLGSTDGRQLVAYEKGFNPAPIMKAYLLVEEARRTGDTVTVTGKLKKCATGLRFQVSSVRYGDTLINTDHGPFVEDLYSEGLPWTPLFYDGLMYYPGEFPY